MKDSSVLWKCDRSLDKSNCCADPTSVKYNLKTLGLSTRANFAVQASKRCL
ncbi:hypothetical protein [Nostoc punctiforme]|uniref:hypothetical protein n=1 Tax=Nostoc punctiforme TaxID=272131 RepID=UPI000306847C|nr:hypothetical protein [Nostoc punctiforme]